MPMTILRRKKLTTVILFVFLVSFVLPALADSTTGLPNRIAGVSRYDTAIQISQAGWSSTPNVVLARGDEFADALAGSVLAHSFNAPLLLTPPNQLPATVLAEINRLQAQTVYILGGIGAVSPGIETTLRNANLNVVRISGSDRYASAAQIALTAVPTAAQAFLVNGNSFADALSISSYAAANKIPLLLTATQQVPTATLNALKSLKATNITLIGGTGVISAAEQSQLQGLGFNVSRLAGANRYLTNTLILQNLPFATSHYFVATGTDFPDALAGADLAALQDNPLVLVPQANLPTATMGYLSTLRSIGSGYTVLGGWGAVSFALERTISTGSSQPPLSLQYIFSGGPSQFDQLNSIPNNATDYVDVVAPDWYHLTDVTSGQTSTGAFSGIWPAGSDNYTQFVSEAHQKSLKVLPVLNSGWSNTYAIDSLLKTPASRANLINQLTQNLQVTQADGVVIDFEFMNPADMANLTQFMHELYGRLHPLSKLVVMAVLSRTATQTWASPFDYATLAQNVDYLDLMTYDYHTSTPGPIAPLDWVKSVLAYTQGQNVPMQKVLLGIPYYGRDWTKTTRGYTNQAINLTTALARAAQYNAKVTYVTTTADTVGIPTFTYTDSAKAVHTVYFDDSKSWGAKLNLVTQYHLGGVADWALYWVDSSTGAQLYPQLHRYLR